MKKIIGYVLGFVLICFLLPILGATPFSSKEVSKGVEEEKKENPPAQSTYDYKQYQIVKLYHTKTSAMEELPIDDYLVGVIAGEMPVDFEKEALKAQAVVARTYTIYKSMHNKGKHGEAQICDDASCCQAWITKEYRFERWPENSDKEANWRKLQEAVNSTQGKMITYQGEPIDAFFHSNSGGTTELPINVWGGSGYPYLQVVQTAGEDAYRQYQSEVSLTKEELTNKIKAKHSDITIDWTQENAVQILEYTDGSRVKTVKIGNLELAGVEVRTLLGLKSANFEIKQQEDTIIFSVKGFRSRCSE